MEVLAFTVINKEIECDIKQVVGDNDYQASFMLDDEWNDKEVICRVVWNNRTSLDIALEDLSCVIPAYIMKRGEVSIGVYAEGDEQLTTEPWLLSVRKSIREKEFETAMPHKEIWNEINEKIKNVITSNDLDEKVVLSLNDAIEKSGLVKNDELSTEVSTQVNAYLGENFTTENVVTSPQETKDIVFTQNGTNVLINAQGNQLQKTWGNSFKSDDIKGYNTITLRAFTDSTYPPVIFYDENGNFISTLTDYESGSWITYENVTIPNNASYFYVNCTAATAIPTASVTKDEITEEVIRVKEENLSSDFIKNLKRYINRRDMRLPQFMNWEIPATDTSYMGQFVVEGKYLYLTRHANIYKIDVSCEVEPTVVSKVAFAPDIWARTCTGMVINGDYIYLGTRRATANYPTEEIEGALFIINKSDLSTVTYLTFDKKVSRIALHENNLAVNLQMRGWRLFDVSDAANPNLVYDEDFPEDASNVCEVQGGQIFIQNDKLYYAIAGFGDGIYLYDISTPSAPTRLWKFEFRNYSELKTKIHTYDLVVDYPYIYATVAPASGDMLEGIQGIITLDISDITTLPTEYKLSLIATEDKNNKVTKSDSEPTIICKFGNRIIVNNDARGVAFFDAGDNPKQPDYEGTYSPHDGCCIYRMVTTPDGRLFLADGSGGAGRLYLLRGIDNLNK